MTTPRSRPVWRSMLFVPTTAEKFIEKAPTSGADAIILDLEDAVAPNAKDSARAALPGVAKRLAEQGLDVTVRINRPWRLAVKDIEAAVSEHVVALLLPMTDTAAHVKEVDQVVSEIEAEKGLPHGHTFFCPLIETRRGLSQRPRNRPCQPADDVVITRLRRFRAVHGHGGCARDPLRTQAANHRLRPRRRPGPDGLHRLDCGIPRHREA